MLLKHFVDLNGHLWVAFDGKVFPSNQINAFVIRDLYTKSDFSNARPRTDFDDFLESIAKNYDFEDQLSEFEAKADPVVLHILARARSGQSPQLARVEREAWGQFAFALARRTPEAQQRVSAKTNRDDVFYQTVKESADRENFPLPSKEQLMADVRIQTLRDLVIANTDATFAAGDHPHLRNETTKFLSETGLCVGIIKLSDKEFIIGSHGLAIVEPEFDRDPAAGSWIPIAPDVAIKVTPFPDKEFFVALDAANDGERTIAAINAASAKSRMIAGRSQRLIRSMMPKTER